MSVSTSSALILVYSWTGARLRLIYWHPQLNHLCDKSIAIDRRTRFQQVGGRFIRVEVNKGLSNYIDMNYIAFEILETHGFSRGTNSPYCLAHSATLTHCSFTGNSSKLPMMGFPLGPGGNGKAGGHISGALSLMKLILTGALGL